MPQFNFTFKDKKGEVISELPIDAPDLQSAWRKIYHDTKSWDSFHNISVKEEK